MDRRRPARRIAADEQVLDRFRPHWSALLPALLWAMMLAVAAGATLAVAPLGWQATLLGAAGLWLLAAGRNLLRWLRRRVVLTTHRLWVDRGRHHPELPLELVADAWYEQRLRDRLIGVGDVVVLRGDGLAALRITDVPDPAGFTGELLAARDERLAHRPPPAMGPVDPVDRTA